MRYPGRLYIARHGETEFNRKGRLQGHTDIPLNETGRVQAAALAARVRDLGIVRTGSSTLLRARETAEICAGALGVPCDFSDADLRERSYGTFEGLTRDELLSQHGEAYQAWRSDNRFTPPGAEPFEELAKRVVRAVERASHLALSLDGGLLLVSHGGAMRALTHALSGTLPPPIANTAVFRVVLKGQRLVSLEDV